MKHRALAIHLPQFHPFPENDAWWGKGFTEWTNTTKAKPLFEEHYQPHLPADLGFYDLRLEESLIAQADLAKEYGIYGFCFYHYWFNGKRLLHTPIDNMLASGKPDFPFCFCWANENWTRRWDGHDDEVLMKQDYDFEDDLRHIQFLFPTFEDSRYIRIDNKPFFIVYRTELFPDIKKTTTIWRNAAQKAGFDGLYLAYMDKEPFPKHRPEDLGFDAAIQFCPTFIRENMVEQVRQAETFVQKIRNKKSPKRLPEHRLYDYQEMISAIQQLPPVDFKRFPGIFPSWDNTARRKVNALIFKDASPYIYEKWFKTIVANFTPYSEEENFIFINAWNEWAEGNHLEPCQKWGRAYLEATQNALLK
ncbi:MAG: glycoside hydrolase family 99-like domain-containing protein [Chitinophagales bacterium]